jgi:hypothetical protein
MVEKVRMTELYKLSNNALAPVNRGQLANEETIEAWILQNSGGAGSADTATTAESDFSGSCITGYGPLPKIGIKRWSRSQRQFRRSRQTTTPWKTSAESIWFSMSSAATSRSGPQALGFRCLFSEAGVLRLRNRGRPPFSRSGSDSGILALRH